MTEICTFLETNVQNQDAAGPVPSGSAREDPPPASLPLLELPEPLALLGWQVHCPSLCLRL